MKSLYEQQVELWNERGVIDTYWTDELVERSKWFAKHLDQGEKANKTYRFDSAFEFGCHNGRNLYYLKETFPKIKVGGMDLNEDVLNVAREKVPEATFECGDILSYNGEEKYDLVFTYGVLMHVPPQYIGEAIDKCIAKANKYVMHIERSEHDGTVFRAPGKVNGQRPHKISKEFRWAPPLLKLYGDKGYEIECHNYIRDCKIALFVIDLSKKK